MGKGIETEGKRTESSQALDAFIQLPTAQIHSRMEVEADVGRGGEFFDGHGLPFTVDAGYIDMSTLWSTNKPIEWREIIFLVIEHGKRLILRCRIAVNGMRWKVWSI